MSFHDAIDAAVRAARELQSRYRPGEPYRPKEHHHTQTPPSKRKQARRRINRAARQARRQNRRLK